MLQIFEIDPQKITPLWGSSEVETPAPRDNWFRLTPIAKGIEQMLREQYKEKYLFSTALTSKLQIIEHYLNDSQDLVP